MRRMFIAVQQAIFALLLSACVSGSSGGGSAGNGQGLPSSQTDPGVGWLPGVASTSPSGSGQSGLFLVPAVSSGSVLANSPPPPVAPVFITSTQVRILGAIQVLSYSGTLGSAEGVYQSSAYTKAIVYVGTCGDGNVHVCTQRIDNSAATTKPVPTPIGSSTFSSVQAVCNAYAAYENVLDPNSAFYIIGSVPPGGSGCDYLTLNYTIVHYSDAPTTAPYSVGIHPSTTTPGVVPFYTPQGVLGGLLEFETDPGNGTGGPMNFYADSTFTRMTPITTGVVSASVIKKIDALNDYSLQLAFNGTLGFFSVFTSSGKDSVYRVDANGGATIAYQANGVLSTSDRAYDSKAVYVVDVSTTANPASSTIVQLPISGAVSTNLYVTPPANAVTYSIVGSDGTNLMLLEADSSGAVTANSLLSLPLTTTTAPTPTTLVGPFNGTVNSVLFYGNNLSVNPPTNTNKATAGAAYVSFSGQVAGATQYQDFAITTAGTFLSPLQSNAAFVGQAPNLYGLVIFEAVGITDTSGGYGGARIIHEIALTPFAWNMSNLPPSDSNAYVDVATALPYTIPSGQKLSVGRALSADFAHLTIPTIKSDFGTYLPVSLAHSGVNSASLYFCAFGSSDFFVAHPIANVAQVSELL